MASAIPHLYGVLGVARDIDSEGLKRAYRALAARFHPDLHAGSLAATARAEARMKAVNDAWEVLSDPGRKAEYDARLAMCAEAAAPPEGWVDRVFGVKARGAEPGRNRRYRATVQQVDVVRGSERIVELPKSVPCGACGACGWAPEGAPIVCERCGGRAEVVTRPVVRASWDACPSCDGRGWVPAIACATCEGRGEVLDRETIIVPVPAGVRPGEILRVRGMGEPGDPPGDLLLEIQVAPDPRFEVRGLDVVHRRALPFWHAVAGGPLDVFTAWGRATVIVPPGSRDGDVLRIPGWGVGRHGDQRVVLAVEWPSALSEDARDALGAWGRSLPVETFPLTERQRREGAG